MLPAWTRAARHLGHRRHPRLHRHGARPGHAYASGGAVYFDVGTFERFGQISHYSPRRDAATRGRAGRQPRRPEQARPARLRAVAAVACRTSRRGSRCGVRAGRAGTSSARRCACASSAPPSTCTAAGSDLIFPHHECEAAQSEAATGEPLVRHWMHQAMVRMDGEKMSKSLGNLVFVSDLAQEWDPRAIRLACIAHHYRTAWEWDDTLMPDAAERLDRVACRRTGRWRPRRGAPGRSTTTSTPPERWPRSTRLRLAGSASARRRRCSASSSTEANACRLPCRPGGPRTICEFSVSRSTDIWSGGSIGS